MESTAYRSPQDILESTAYRVIIGTVVCRRSAYETGSDCIVGGDTKMKKTTVIVIMLLALNTLTGCCLFFINWRKSLWKSQAMLNSQPLVNHGIWKNAANPE